MDNTTSNESTTGIASGLEELLENIILRCDTCHSRFDQIKHTPKMLPCGHTFCQGCMTSVGFLTKTYPDVYSLECPVCRCHHPLQNKIEDLPNNYTIIKVLDIINSMIFEFSNGGCHKNVKAVQAMGEYRPRVKESMVKTVETQRDSVAPAGWQDKKRETFLTLTFNPDDERTEVFISYTNPDDLPSMYFS
ncbi:unnamed protein product [Lymnaea stagnalis]|uniref:RING-type domain-containing protein n=1 Tax=Lymnaea stagnalis TaxID=6523 RepID=A0AAV2I6V4_LYMST